VWPRLSGEHVRGPVIRATLFSFAILVALQLPHGSDVVVRLDRVVRGGSDSIHVVITNLSGDPIPYVEEEAAPWPVLSYELLDEHGTNLTPRMAGCGTGLKPATLYPSKTIELTFPTPTETRFGSNSVHSIRLGFHTTGQVFWSNRIDLERAF